MDCGLNHCEENGFMVEIDESERMLNMDEAAEYLGYKPSGLYEIVGRTKHGKAGAQLQFYQIGTGPIKFRREWLDEFVEANSIKPGEIVPAKKPQRGRRAVGGRVPIEPIWATAT
jgi:hypothetical protein